MEQMQREMLAKCDRRGGWPRPFVHFGGAIELARSPEHYDRLLRQEVRIIVYSVLFVPLIIGAIVWTFAP